MREWLGDSPKGGGWDRGCSRGAEMWGAGGPERGWRQDAKHGLKNSAEKIFNSLIISINLIILH